MANEFSRLRVAKATYSFAVDGGAISTIIPSVADIIPTGALIKEVVFNTRTIVTGGGGATVAITGGGITLIAADTLANNELDEANPTVVFASTSDPLIATASAPIKVVVAVAAALEQPVIPEKGVEPMRSSAS